MNVARRSQVGLARVEEVPGFGSSRSCGTRECRSFDLLDEVVEGFGGSVGFLGDVQVGDLGGPAGMVRPSLLLSGRAGLVLEVVGELESV